MWKIERRTSNKKSDYIYRVNCKGQNYVNNMESMCELGRKSGKLNLRRTLLIQKLNNTEEKTIHSSNKKKSNIQLSAEISSLEIEIKCIKNKMSALM